MQMRMRVLMKSWAEAGAFVAIGCVLGDGAASSAEQYSLCDVGDLPGGNDESRANAINASGAVVGWSVITGGFRRPFRWTGGGGLVDLSLQPENALFVEANDVDDAGRVVGFRSGPQGNHACLYEAGEDLLDLGVLIPPDRYSGANAINANGLVVGYGAAPGTDEPAALIWPNATPSPNPLGDLAGGVALFAFDRARGRRAARA